MGEGSSNGCLNSAGQGSLNRSRTPAMSTDSDTEPDREPESTPEQPETEPPTPADYDGESTPNDHPESTANPDGEDSTEETTPADGVPDEPPASSSSTTTSSCSTACLASAGDALAATARSQLSCHQFAPRVELVPVLERPRPLVRSVDAKDDPVERERLLRDDRERALQTARPQPPRLGERAGRTVRSRPRRPRPLRDARATKT